LGKEQIANVYARALFDAAKDSGTLETTGTDLSRFVDAMQESKELTAVMHNPKIDSETKKRIVSELTQGADRMFINGLFLLIDKLHSDLVVGLNEQFQKLVKKENKILEVDITSAVELEDEIKARIRERIEQATHMKVEIRESVQEDIIGGLVLRFGDVIVDGSLKAKFMQLRARLAQANLGSEDSFETAS
jgi:F-type H+-transporting ATPase subunit delta